MKWLRQNKGYLIILAVLLTLEIAFFYYPLDYIVYYDGLATNLAPYITVSDGDTDDTGGFYMLSVYTAQANGAIWLRAQFDHNLDLKAKGAVIPAGMTVEEYDEQMLKNMSESQKKAVLVALQKAGRSVSVSGGGVEIADFTPACTLREQLQIGDVIMGFNGKRIILNEDLQRALLQVQVNDSVELQLLRQGNSLTLPVKVGQDAGGAAKLGIYLSQVAWDLSYDGEISFSDQNIGGGSAGLMMTLEIINRCLPEDLTRGHQIAGTGTIRLDGSIGAIEGVKQKLHAAEKAGAGYFLVPQENYEAARSLAATITVIPVQTLDDALQFLAGLNPAP
ncbi:MAG: PDZ domain-containing protein [Negativicutes bacterium]|nr:PDZ domain-containing protein [Negativicutes bacterium]